MHSNTKGRVRDLIVILYEVDKPSGLDIEGMRPASTVLPAV
jgi:hypothetical protein